MLRLSLFALLLSLLDLIEHDQIEDLTSTRYVKNKHAQIGIAIKHMRLYRFWSDVFLVKWMGIFICVRCLGLQHVT